MRTQEFTGKTTQEAIDAGLAALGVTIADVHVDVIQEGAKGLFGLFGSKPACVRLTVMEDEKEDDHGLSDLLSSFSLSEPKAKKPEKKAEKNPAEKKAEPKPEKKPVAKPKEETVEEQPETADERPIIAKLRKAMKAYDLTEEQMFNKYNPKHTDRYGEVSSLSEWSDKFVEWLLNGMDKIAKVLKK